MGNFVTALGACLHKRSDRASAGHPRDWIDMFNAVLAEHQAKQSALREENDRLRRVAGESVGRVTEALVDTLNAGVADAFRTQKQIELDARRLQVQI